MTARILLRAWRPADRDAFAALNADPVVMEHFPGTASRAESDVFADMIEAEFATEGFGLWSVEIPGVTQFAGFTGLHRVQWEAHFTPAVEIGWRFAEAHWGQGYATEAAQEALRRGFDEHALEEIVSFTVPANARSRRVMEKIGMTRDADGDFDHPRLPEGHQLRRHVLYRISRPASSG